VSGSLSSVALGVCTSKLLPLGNVTKIVDLNQTPRQTPVSYGLFTLPYSVYKMWNNIFVDRMKDKLFISAEQSDCIEWL
jgi:hypothetical protein